MSARALHKSEGFTLIEVAIVLGVLGAVLLVTATLLAGTMNSYAKITSETETIKNARHCLEQISRDVRESVNFDIQNPATGAALGTTIDAMLLTSSRGSDNSFAVDIDNFPQPQSIILYYLNQTNEGITQLIRHQVFYAEDLLPFGFVPPFQLRAPAPYDGPNIVIVDSVGRTLFINRTTGGAGGVLPFRPPKVMMVGSTSLDFVGMAPTPIQARITCQFTDQYGRATTTRLGTTIKPRNL
jgi:prepilin-type N-terminal cleavage/methylation domain-containing protein